MDDLQQTYISQYKKLALLDAGIDYTDIDAYEKYLTGDDEHEIKQQAEELAQDISAHNTARFDTHHDKRTLTLFDK